MLAPTFVAVGRVVLRAAKRDVIAREHSDRGNLPVRCLFLHRIFVDGIPLIRQK